MKRILELNGADRRFVCGAGQWKKGRLPLGSGPERAMAACGAWMEENTYVAKVCFYETPFCLTMKLQFAGDRLIHEAEMNVGFGPTGQPRLEGHLR